MSRNLLVGSRKHRSTVAIALVLLASTLVSCARAAPEQGPKPEDTAELVAQLPEPDGPVDQISWNLTTGEPTTLDPRNAVTYSSGQVVANLCDFLLRRDSEFDTYPNLAEIEQTSPTEAVIRLRDDARFWDGSPVTAADVIYSLERAADPGNSIVAFVFGAVQSIQPGPENSVVVTFSEPDASFVHGMATIAGAIIQQEWAEQAEGEIGSNATGLMCSGPYKLESWQSGSSMTLEKNDDYWNADLVPFADRVDFSFVTDTNAVAQALDAGDMDGSYEIPATVLPALRESAQGQLILGPSTQTFALNFAHAGGPFADQRLRLALQKSLDRDSIASIIFDGAAEASYAFLSTTSWPNESSDIYADGYEKWVEERAYDIEAAAELVDASTYDGATVTLGIAAGNDAESRVAQLVQQQMKAVGVELTIEPLQPLVAAQAAFDPTAREGLDLLLRSSFNSSQSPIEPLFFAMLPGQAYNTSEFDNDEVTRLLYEARAEFDPRKQAELLVQAQDIYESENPTIPVVELRTRTFLNNALTGAVTSFAYWGMPQMAYIGSAG
ncbi:ABC transporter substrate-binding protein [Leucobacter sp. G161]|uniref:ABC transporter substrate-binding protein n=1 Tax=Leucobacter sp. G161 TaxID=663704 RepID=UPI00073E1804|nr:ABC transporter substrate-binding protein [Leucobacter sp. G161]